MLNPARSSVSHHILRLKHEVHRPLQCSVLAHGCVIGYLLSYFGASFEFIHETVGSVNVLFWSRVESWSYLCSVWNVESGYLFIVPAVCVD